MGRGRHREAFSPADAAPEVLDSSGTGQPPLLPTQYSGPLHFQYSQRIGRRASMVYGDCRYFGEFTTIYVTWLPCVVG